MLIGIDKMQRPRYSPKYFNRSDTFPFTVWCLTFYIKWIIATDSSLRFVVLQSWKKLIWNVNIYFVLLVDKTNTIIRTILNEYEQLYYFATNDQGSGGYTRSIWLIKWNLNSTECCVNTLDLQISELIVTLFVEATKVF